MTKLIPLLFLVAAPFAQAQNYNVNCVGLDREGNQIHSTFTQANDGSGGMELRDFPNSIHSSFKIPQEISLAALSRPVSTVPGGGGELSQWAQSKDSNYAVKFYPGYLDAGSVSVYVFSQRVEPTPSFPDARRNIQNWINIGSLRLSCRRAL